MKTMGTEKQRKAVINKLYETIKAATERGLTVDRDKTLAYLCFEHGLTKKTAINYFQVLIDANLIIERPDGFVAKDVAS